MSSPRGHISAPSLKRLLRSLGRMFRRLRKLTAIGPYRDSVVQDEESMRLAEELARRFEEQQRAA